MVCQQYYLQWLSSFKLHVWLCLSLHQRWHTLIIYSYTYTHISPESVMEKIWLIALIEIFSSCFALYSRCDNLIINAYLLQDNSHQNSTNTTSTCLSRFVGKQTIQTALTCQKLTFMELKPTSVEEARHEWNIRGQVRGDKHRITLYDYYYNSTLSYIVALLRKRIKL